MPTRRGRKGEGYESQSNQTPWTTPMEHSGDNHDPRQYSANDFVTTSSYELAPSVTTSSYGAYPYSSNATSHPVYYQTYEYSHPQYPVPHSQSFTAGDPRSLPYRSDYRSEYADSSYSTAEPPSPPAIEVSQAPAQMTIPNNPWEANYNNGAPYGTSYEQTQNGFGLTSSLQRQPSNGSEGGQSQDSDGKDRRFTCDRDTECKAAFVRKADLLRHIDCVHVKAPQYSCPVKNCSRKGQNGFTRRDHRTEHLRHFHHRIIPKRPRGNQNVDEEDDEEDTHYNN